MNNIYLWMLFCILGLNFAKPTGAQQSLPSSFNRLVAENEDESESIDAGWLPEPAAAANGSRIAYGSSVSSSKYPFAAYIYGKNFQCTGSLVAPRVVASAAHCAYGKSGWTVQIKDVRVRLGNSNVKDAKEFRVKSITVPKYNPYSNYGDISLFELTQAVPYKPITLPTSSFKIPKGTKAMVVGWGQTDKGDYPFKLQAASMTLLSTSQCNTVHRIAFGVNVVRDHICAGDSDRQGTCGGDSGGPYFVSRSGKYVQVGIVSYGPGDYKCGQNGNLDVPTSMIYWADWVRKVIKKYRMG